MKPWLNELRFDPLPALLESNDAAVPFFTRRDLLDEVVESVEELWASGEVVRLVRRQLPSGAWKYPAPRTKLRSIDNYNQIETFRVLGELVEKHGLHRGHSAIRRAARFVLSHQSVDGDIRGIYGNQYSPNYTAALLELLIKAGFASDARVRRGCRWLLSIRQEDGGWAIPLRTTGGDFRPSAVRAPVIQPVRSRPSSHMVTGVVLRALAAHPKYRTSGAARTAGMLLASRFFKPDVYPDRRAATFWTRFGYPFWFTDLLSALDSLSRLGLSPDAPPIQRGLRWFITHQHRSGLWKLRVTRGRRESDHDAWLTLAMCRVFKRFFTVR
jgi:hypothetical protein